MSGSNVQDLGQGGQQSIHALIQAIAPDIARSSGGNLTSDEVSRRLNDKLAELVGPDSTEKRNERGELINEEGLPIVEISEPVDPTDLRTSISLPTPVTVEPLLPLASLTDDARARLRAMQNQILDQLEEEEKQAEITQRQREVEANENLARKMKEEAVKEKERLKEARELQKKMGRALLLNVSKAREKERQEQAAQRLRDEEVDQDRKRSPTMKKKTVAFADCTEQIDLLETDPDPVSTDWGDVTPGQLTQRKRPTLHAQALLDIHPMKMNVVERMPSRKTAEPTGLAADSDDDSGSEHPSDSSDNEEGEPSLETDEYDFDMAQHGREIALEYHTKRKTIGKESAQALMLPNEVDSQQHATQDLLQEPSKPTISHFKADRLASAYMSAPSSSLSANVVPASSARTIQRSVRTGKLDSDGHLVGGEEDSASEHEAEGLQDVLELIRKGEIYNVGPNGEYTPPPNHHESPQSSHQSSSSVQGGGSLPFQTSTLPGPSMRSKTSKFKASRATAGRPSPGSLSLPVIDTPISSASTTPVSFDNRSSPKLDTPTTPVITPTVGERKRPAAAPSVPAIAPSRHEVHQPQPALIASNHFLTTTDPHAQAMPPMVIESPSFPQTPSRLARPPTILTSKVVESRQPPTRPGPQISKQSNPPLAVSSIVQESYPSVTQSPGPGQDRNKVSRFMTERGS